MAASSVRHQPRVAERAEFDEPRTVGVLGEHGLGHAQRQAGLADPAWPGQLLSIRAVERHISNLYAKIGARSTADATAYVFRHQLI